MPLAIKPHRPKPEVELLRRRHITFEDAGKLLEQSLRGKKQEDETSTGDANDKLSEDAASPEVPGCFLVSFRDIPTVLKCVQNDWVTWDPELRPLNSCFVEVTGRLETHLHPCFLGKLGVGLRGAAGCLLHRWIDSLKCFPLAFVELKPAGSHAAVVAESPYVHFLSEFRAVGFAPNQGDWLVGRMSTTQSRVGLNVTVLGLVNSFVKADKLPDDLQFDKQSQLWSSNGNAEDDEGVKKKKSKAKTQKVWLKLTQNPETDMRLNPRTGVMDLKCELGWPTENMPAKLAKDRKAKAKAESSRSQKSAKPRADESTAAAPGAGRGNTSATGRGGARGRGRGRGHAVGAEPTDASAGNVKKGTKADVASDGKKSKKDAPVAEPTEADVASGGKKKKKDAPVAEPTEEPITASNKKKRKQREEHE